MIMAGEVEEDGSQPCVKGGPTLEPMDRLQCLEKSLLDQVLCVGLASAKQKRGTQQAIAARLDELLHGRGFPIPERRD